MESDTFGMLLIFGGGFIVVIVLGIILISNTQDKEEPITGEILPQYVDMAFINGINQTGAKNIDEFEIVARYGFARLGNESSDQGRMFYDDEYYVIINDNQEIVEKGGLPR